MDRLHYLADPEVRGFTGYLRSLANRGNGAVLGIGRGSRRRPITTLLEAQRAFRWRGRDFMEVSEHLDHFRREMAEAMAGCRINAADCGPKLAQYELLYVCTKVLEWANCLKGTLGYLSERAQAGALSSCLARAVAVIDSGRDDTAAFQAAELRSDPQIARLYAIMNGHTVAYNGRLAAALCLLCRHYCGDRPLPALLDFRLASRRPRHDPSRPEGPQFRPFAHAAEHARWTIRASWIVDAVAADDRLAADLGTSRQQRLRALEAALFMVGDDVSSQPVRSRRSPLTMPAHLSRRVRSTG